MGVGSRRAQAGPSAADPAIVRADGYPASFSSTLNPEQETIQGRWNEFDSAIFDAIPPGVTFYDAGINYVVSGDDVPITNEAGVLYRALVTNGPDTSNAIAPSADTAGTTWARVSGVQSAPAAPAQPTATIPASLTLDVQWNCPLDGGAAIIRFEFQYKNAGTSWTTAQQVDTTIPVTQLTGLTSGQALEFRVLAVNSIGSSPWSPTGTGTPVGTVPSGGSTFALQATARDTQVALTWLEPDDGGEAIIRYEVQWRSDSQAFSSSRQASVTTESYTRTGLTNGTLYFFRVLAVNSIGSSTWSNEAMATPVSGEHRVTTPGTTTFAWPWSATSARVVMVSGTGGTGGGGGGGSGSGGGGGGTGGDGGGGGGGSGGGG